MIVLALIAAILCLLATGLAIIAAFLLVHEYES